MRRVGWSELLAAGAFCCASTAFAQGLCGDLQGGYGPFDYRTATPQQKRLVEGTHFLPHTEALTRGETGSIGADIGYTLRAFPNHPRALNAMMNLATKQRRDPPSGSQYTLACWFDRAIRFSPDDPNVRTLFGIYLARSGKRAEAVEQLQFAEKLAGESANVQYNLGLVYFDLGDYDKSIEYAKKAYASGFPLPGLRDKLKKAGKWHE